MQSMQYPLSAIIETNKSDISYMATGDNHSKTINQKKN